VVNIKEHGFLTVQPGDFAVVTALEIIRLGPQYVGRFGLRSKFARKGLIATTGPQIDPGYHGRLMIGMTNLSPKPVTLSFADDLLSVEFHRLAEASTHPYSGPYQDRLTLGPEEIESISENEGMAFSEVLTTLRSLSQNVGSLAAEVKVLKVWIPVMLTIVTIGIAVIGIIVSFKKWPPGRAQTFSALPPDDCGVLRGGRVGRRRSGRFPSRNGRVRIVGALSEEGEK
jgi:hypothetical protein